MQLGFVHAVSRRAVGRPVRAIYDRLPCFGIGFYCVLRRRLAAALKRRILGTSGLCSILVL